MSNRWGQHDDVRRNDDGSRLRDGLGKVRVSEAAKLYVQALVASPLGKSIPQAQRSVLRVLAWRHRLEVNCAWAGVPDIALEALMSERSVQRALRVLDTRGLIRCYEAVRKNGSKASSEYEFPGMKGTAVTAAMRQQVFKTPRERVAVQMDLSLAGERWNGHDTNGGQGSAVDRGLENNHNVATNEGQTGSVVGQDACGNLRAVSPPLVTTVVTTPGDNMVSPLEDISEHSLKISPPLPRLIGTECGKATAKAPIKASTEARATARATATATTSAMREAEAAIDVCEAATLSLGAGPGVPKEDLFYGFGDKTVFAAALLHDVELILVACGIAPGNVTRRQRKAVLNALCEWMASTGKSMAVAGTFAVDQWRYYQDRSEGFVYKVDARRFFAEGIWLQDWTSPAYQPRSNRRTGFDPTIGMRRQN